MKLEWQDYIEQLRGGLGRGPETAAAIRAALAKQYGQSGEELYRMLWGFTDKDLRAGDDEMLVKSLDHETLAMRVVSFQNLKEIVGGATHHYQPELSAAKRQQAVRTWKKLRDSGAIVWKANGEPATKPPTAGEPAAPPAEKEF
jgi:hypothetical protein